MDSGAVLRKVAQHGDQRVREEIAEFSTAKTVLRRQEKTMFISLGFLKITTGEELGQITNCLSPTIES